MRLAYGRGGRLTVKNGGFWSGQIPKSPRYIGLPGLLPLGDTPASAVARDGGATEKGAAGNGIFVKGLKDTKVAAREWCDAIIGEVPRRTDATAYDAAEGEWFCQLQDWPELIRSWDSLQELAVGVNVILTITLCISLVCIYTKYTGARVNDFTAHG
jgi:hypothetical protein